MDNRVLLKRVLEAEGYRVLEAGGFADALHLARTNRMDLILIDINMPEVDGLSLTRELRAQPATASVPVVAITANVMRGDQERSLAAGCDGYIQKPIDVDLLPRQIARFIGRRGVEP